MFGEDKEDKEPSEWRSQGNRYLTESYRNINILMDIESEEDREDRCTGSYRQDQQDKSLHNLLVKHEG